MGAQLNGTAHALAFLANGELLVGGEFTTAGSGVHAYLARLETTCPASATGHGSGCPSTGGNNLLAGVGLPFCGCTFEVAGSGLPPSSLVALVIGTTPVSVPLSSLTPLAQPGCDQLAAADALVLLTSSAAGDAQLSFALPDTPAFAGVQLFHQMIPWDAGTNAITATNALASVVGSF